MADGPRYPPGAYGRCQLGLAAKAIDLLTRSPAMSLRNLFHLVVAFPSLYNTPQIDFATNSGSLVVPGIVFGSVVSEEDARGSSAKRTPLGRAPTDWARALRSIPFDTRSLPTSDLRRGRPEFGG